MTCALIRWMTLENSFHFSELQCLYMQHDENKRHEKTKKIKSNLINKQYRAYGVTDTVLDPLHTLTHLIFITIL